MLLGLEPSWYIQQQITQSDNLISYNPIYVLLVQNHLFTTLTQDERDVMYRVSKAESKLIQMLDNNVNYRGTITNDIKKHFKHDKQMPYVKSISQAYLKLDQIIYVTNKLGHHIIPPKLIGLHLCEAPGQFIFRLNRERPNYEWIANSLPINKSEDTIGDDYKIIKMNPSKWLMCDVGEVDKQLPKTFKPNLITSDLGLPNTKWKQEEVLIQPQTVVVGLILTRLSIGGNCILKCFLPCRLDQSIKIITSLYNNFEYLYFIKPSLNFDSAEFYIVGINKLNKPNNETDKNVQGKLSQMTIMFKYYNIQSTFCKNKDIINNYAKEQANLIYNN